VWVRGEGGGREGSLLFALGDERDGVVVKEGDVDSTVAGDALDVKGLLPTKEKCVCVSSSGKVA
jgi:hypothetical protein